MGRACADEFNSPRPHEVRTFEIENVSFTPSQVWVYVEGVSDIDQFPTFGISLRLSGPVAGTPTNISLGFAELGNKAVFESPITLLGNQINGTWTLCPAYQSIPGGTVSKWGLYIQ